MTTITHRPTCHHGQHGHKITDAFGNIVAQCRCICTCPRVDAVMTTPTPIEEIVQEFEKLCNEGFADNRYTKTANYSRLSIYLRTTLTTYGNARYEEGVKAEATRRDGIERAIEQSIIDQHVTMAVKAERERVGKWAQTQKEKLVMKWDNDKAKSTVYDAILYGWNGYLSDNQ